MTTPPPSVVPPAGWYADPWGSSAWRWWDGARWTGYTDEWFAASTAAPAPAVTLDESVPIRAGWIAIGGAVVGVALSIVVYVFLRSGVGVRPSSPILALLAQVGLWVGLLAACRIAVRRHGTGSLRDLGLRMRGIDLPLGVGFGASLLVGVGTLALILQRIGIEPHREGLVEPMERGPLTVVVILFVAVIGAPFVEELFFRGLLMSGFVERFGVVGGILAQAVIFGAVHLGPTDARGNLGVFLLIAPVGAVLGVLRFRYRRLGTGMITHAVYNAIIMSVALDALERRGGRAPRGGRQPGRPRRLEGRDRVGVLLGEPDVVQPVEETVLHMVVEVERLVEVDSGDGDPAIHHVDDDLERWVVPDRVHDPPHDGFGHLDRDQAALQRVVAEDVGEPGRDDRLEAVVLQSPDRVLA